MNHLALLFFFTVLPQHWVECIALKCGKFNMKNDTDLGKGPTNVCMCVCLCGWERGVGEKKRRKCVELRTGFYCNVEVL